MYLQDAMKFLNTFVESDILIDDHPCICNGYQTIYRDKVYLRAHLLQKQTGRVIFLDIPLQEIEDMPEEV